MKTIAELKSAGEQENVSNEPWLEVVRQQVGSLKVGVVQIVVHGARVVQVERTEKMRLVNPIAIANRED
jgi:hypothetical protein